jgi:hypothetical protein
VQRMRHTAAGLPGVFHESVCRERRHFPMPCRDWRVIVMHGGLWPRCRRSPATVSDRGRRASDLAAELSARRAPSPKGRLAWSVAPARPPESTETVITSWKGCSARQPPPPICERRLVRPVGLEPGAEAKARRGPEAIGLTSRANAWLVRPVGLEPTTNGLKVLAVCLHLYRHPAVAEDWGNSPRGFLAGRPAKYFGARSPTLAEWPRRLRTPPEGRRTAF